MLIKLTDFTERNSSIGKTKCRSRWLPILDVKSYSAILSLSGEPELACGTRGSFDDVVDVTWRYIAILIPDARSHASRYTVQCSAVQ